MIIRPPRYDAVETVQTSVSSRQCHEAQPPVPYPRGTRRRCLDSVSVSVSVSVSTSVRV